MSWQEWSQRSDLTPCVIPSHLSRCLNRNVLRAVALAPVMDDKSGGEEGGLLGQGRALHLRGHRWPGHMLLTSLHSLGRNLWCCPWLMGSARPNGPIEASHPDGGPVHPSHVPRSESRYCTSHLLAPLRLNPTQPLFKWAAGAMRPGFSLKVSVTNLHAGKSCKTPPLPPVPCRFHQIKWCLGAGWRSFTTKGEICWGEGIKWLSIIQILHQLHAGCAHLNKNGHQRLISVEPVVWGHLVVCVSSVLRPAVTNGRLPALCSPRRCSQMQQPDAHSLSATLPLQYLSLP